MVFNACDGMLELSKAFKGIEIDTLLLTGVARRRKENNQSYSSAPILKLRNKFRRVNY